MHLPLPTMGLGAHLQVWHTLHWGHCQPERLRGVREMFRQAPWKCCPHLVQNTRSRRSPGPLHTEHRASSVSHERWGSGLPARGVLPCQDPRQGRRVPAPRAGVPSPTYPCPRPQPRARGRAAAGSSWTGSSRWRRHRGSGRGGSSRRPPGMGWWPPPARSIHISRGTGSPVGVSTAAGEPNRAPGHPPRPLGMCSPVRSLRKQLWPRRPPPALHQLPRLHTSGEPSSALWGKGRQR